jgi:signal transduction histidine kinase
MKSSITEDIEKAKREVVEEYRRKKEYQGDLLESLKPELQRRLTFLHDYKQFIAAVKQNINVILETKYIGGTLDEKLKRSTKAEGAIYWAAEIMEEKLDAVFLLTQPDKLLSTVTKMLRIHGAVLKYVRIYQAAYDEKHVRLEVTGESIGEIKANPRHLGIILHALIDNALKYSVRGSKVTIKFEETNEVIEFFVTSCGPRIHQEERQAIFDLLFRGAEAVKQEKEGTGFGLYLAQTGAQQIGTRIQVEQDNTASHFGYETKFSVRFPRAR